MTWKEFELSKIFKNYHGKRLIRENRKSGLTPLLTASENMQGVSDFIANDNMYSYSNFISIDMFGHSFYHNYKCFGDDNIYFFINDKLSKFTKIFLVLCINKNSIKFSYGKQFRQNNADKDKILLPTTPHGEPDYQFMEDYIKELMDKKRQQNIEYITNKLKNIEDNNFISLNKQWKEFRIKDLFNVYTGGDLIINKIKSGNIPVISHSSENNGVVAYSDLIHSRKIFNCKKTISLADRGNFKAFIQKTDFYVGTRVKALEAKFDCISYFSLLFIANEIDKQSCKFSYGYNACNNVEDLKILLPITKQDNPDYEYMEQYIKNKIFKKYNDYLNYIDSQKI